MIILFFFFLFGWNALWSDQEPDPSKLLKIGNLAFPVSQQPTPLLSFGQNLIAKGDSEIQLQGGEFKGKGEYFIDTQLSFIYAFEDNFSIFVNIPRAIRFKRDHETSSGMEDLY